MRGAKWSSAATRAEQRGHRRVCWSHRGPGVRLPLLAGHCWPCEGHPALCHLSPPLPLTSSLLALRKPPPGDGWQRWLSRSRASSIKGCCATTRVFPKPACALHHESLPGGFPKVGHHLQDHPTSRALGGAEQRVQPASPLLCAGRWCIPPPQQSSFLHI